MAELQIGSNFAITANAKIICRKKIIIGNDVLFSWEILLMDTDFHKIIDRYGKRLNSDKEIIINDHCWIGCRSIILKGTSIPKNSVIAAGSIISKKLVAENAIYKTGGGQIKSDVEWRV